VVEIPTRAGYTCALPQVNPEPNMNITRHDYPFKGEAVREPDDR
jgi:hypothetical protein